MSSDEFVAENDIAEVMDDATAPADNMMDSDTEEIDMRNNSTTYFDEHKDAVYLVASHPTLPLVISGGGDDTAYLWTTSHNLPKVLQKLEEPEESVVAGGFTANGKCLVLGDMNGKVMAWKGTKGGEQWKFVGSTKEIEEVVYICFHNSLPMFAVGASDGSIWVYSISTEGDGTLISEATLLGHKASANVISFVGSGADEPKLFSASEDGTMILWDIYNQTKQSVYTLGPTNLKGCHIWVSMALSPTGKTVAVGSSDGFVVLVKLEDGSVLHKLQVPGTPPKSLEEHTDINETKDGEENDEEEEEIMEQDGRSIEGLAWSSKTGLLATGNVDGTVTLWNTSTWRARSSFDLNDSVTKLEFVSNSPMLVVAAMDGTLAEYDAVSGERVWECLGHSEGVLGFAIQKSGKRIISGGDENVCLVFDMPETQQPEQQLQTQQQ